GPGVEGEGEHAALETGEAAPPAHGAERAGASEPDARVSAGRHRAVTPARRAPRVGVLGGTFDPPHFGHLAIAEWARRELDLDRVLFVPAGTPPHKRAAPRTSAARRVAMTRLAIRGNPRFAVSTLEARRPGPSYTSDTLRALAAAAPGTRWHFILGA